MDLHSLLDQDLAHGGANGRILVGHDPRQHLDQRDLAAQQCEEGCPLHAHGASAGYQDVLGDLVQRQRAVAVDDAGQVNARDRRGGGRRAGGHDDGLGRNEFGAVGQRRFHGARAGQPASALEDRYAARLQEALDAAAELANHAVLTPDHRGVVRGHVLDPDAEAGRLLGELEDLGAAEEGLGGDAAAVQADAAEAVGIDQNDLRVQRGCAQGRHVAAGTAAKHTYVGLKGH